MHFFTALSGKSFAWLIAPGTQSPQTAANCARVSSPCFQRTWKSLETELQPMLDSKICGRCGMGVSPLSDLGDICPYCGAVWGKYGTEIKTANRGTSTPSRPKALNDDNLPIGLFSAALMLGPVLYFSFFRDAIHCTPFASCVGTASVWGLIFLLFAGYLRATDRKDGQKSSLSVRAGSIAALGPLAGVLAGGLCRYFLGLRGWMGYVVSFLTVGILWLISFREAKRDSKKQQP